MHSTASDGRLSPTEVVTLAHQSGLGMISLTDHDTVGGLREASSTAKQLGLKFIPGCEVSSISLGQEVHLLAYGFDSSHKELMAFLGKQQRLRTERAHEFLTGLKSVGALPEEAMLPEPSPGKSVARPHIAKLLVDAGTARDFVDAFQRFLTPGSKHFVPKPLPDGSEVINVVHEAGGVVVMAHPGHHARHAVVLKLIEDGLDGMEVIHPSHDNSLEIYYRELAMRYTLMVTGGSDFHGNPRHGGLALGEYWIEPGPKVRGMAIT